MKKIIYTILLLFGILAIGFAESSDQIKHFIDNRVPDIHYKIDEEFLQSSDAITIFYRNREYAPGWSHGGKLTTNVSSLVNFIRKADEHGLQPYDYHLKLIEKYIWKVLLLNPSDSSSIVNLDMLLTDAFLLLGSHLYYGKVDPLMEGASWHMQRKNTEMRLDLKLEEALSEIAPDEMLNSLAPKYRAYWMMKDQLGFFLNLNEHQWPEIKSVLSIKAGESSPLLPEIRERLIRLRYLLSDSISMTSDEEFEKQLKSFQNDWGLNSDGVIGKATLEGLNSIPMKLIAQLRVNMERFRWMPVKMMDRYIIVNIANFELNLIDGSDTLISMRAIVGKELRETPVFNDLMTYIVFSPYWTIPPTILMDDVVPELLRGPEYLTKRNMKLFRMDGTELGYDDIDWTKVSKTNFPYIVRQEPGNANALGKVKFMFPNLYNVYIHDTPSKGSFSRDDRALSSGCIRIEKPYDLALLLLADNVAWSPENVRTAMMQDKEQTVLLEIPVEVFLVYLTAWTDGSDRIQFRKDVYQRDEMVLEALNQLPEASPSKLAKLK